VAIFRLYRGGSCICIGCWDVDLEGFSQSSAGASLAPKRIFASAILSILEIHPTKALIWQQQIEMLSWVGLLESTAQGYLGRNFVMASARRI
jgi:hypothetical protein